MYPPLPAALMRLFYFNRLGPRVYRVDRLYFNLYTLELGFTLRDVCVTGITLSGPSQRRGSGRGVAPPPPAPLVSASGEGHTGDEGRRALASTERPAAAPLLSLDLVANLAPGSLSLRAWVSTFNQPCQQTDTHTTEHVKRHRHRHRTVQIHVCAVCELKKGTTVFGIRARNIKVLLVACM